MKAINDSLGLSDAGLVEQLEAIRQKNTELALSNEQLKLSIERKLEKYQGVKDKPVKDRLQKLSTLSADSSNISLTAAEKEFAKDYYGIN